MVAIVFIIFQIFFATCAVSKIGEYSQWSRDMFRPIMYERYI